MAKARAKTIPLGRLGTKKETGEMVLFLASPVASFVSGDTIVMDGGSWMAGANSLESAEMRLKSVL